MGSPTGRESYGDGGLVVVAGVTPGRGGRESRQQGEGGQVIGHPTTERYAECRPPKRCWVSRRERDAHAVVTGERRAVKVACAVRAGGRRKGPASSGTSPTAHQYLRYGLSYRDVEELHAGRGIEVDHVTVYRWVQRFTPRGARSSTSLTPSSRTAGSTSGALGAAACTPTTLS
jgi:hypothetical protein